MAISMKLNKRSAIMTIIKKTGLELLREPFSQNHISKLPKPTKAQTDIVKADFKKGIRCAECGAWHHPDVVHLDYVGHAALTDRLLDADPNWNWEPLAFDDKGLPLIDANGGMWIKLTVCGVTRLGYGDAPNKTGGDAMKERIGDCLRNAGMRFGAALELWHKGDLHDDDGNSASQKPEHKKPESKRPEPPRPVLPVCTDEEFQKMVADSVNPETGEIVKMRWKSGIQSGKVNAEEAIKTMQTRTLLTDEQIKTIQSWEPAHA
jgi:hypothetical protein